MKIFFNTAVKAIKSSNFLTFKKCNVNFSWELSKNLRSVGQIFDRKENFSNDLA